MFCCQTNCLETYLPQSGCNATDAACICSDATLMGQVGNCSLAACTVLESLSKFIVSQILGFRANTVALPAALNATKTFCGEPVRDLTVITPVVTAVSGTFAIVAVIMRLVDSLARETFLNWSNFCIVASLVRNLEPDLPWRGHGTKGNRPVVW